MSAARIVVAVGGSVLGQRAVRADAPRRGDVETSNVLEAAAALARLAEEVELAVAPGSDPYVRLLALAADAHPPVNSLRLDVLSAESQGMTGYLLVQALRNALPGRAVVAVLTQVAVDGDDPAFARPARPVGPVYSGAEARARAAERRWAVAADGHSFRRLVASPEPVEIVEADSIELLLVSGAIVVCGGGGGIPVVREAGRLRGVDAVIDEDLTAALLAETLGADRLVLATNVPYLERGWGSPGADPISSASPAELRQMSFAAGSMGPKVDAACRFVTRTGGTAVIGALTDLDALVRGDAGTQITARTAARL